MKLPLESLPWVWLALLALAGLLGLLWREVRRLSEAMPSTRTIERCAKALEDISRRDAALHAVLREQGYEWVATHVVEGHWRKPEKGEKR